MTAFPPLPRPAALHIAPAVQTALTQGQPVVALESTLITHGLPAPHNLAVGQALEQTVREHGAVPATIALIEGRLCVGLTAPDWHTLAACGPQAAKASTRDLAALAVRGATAGTTVAATMRLAAAAGIAVFATGGIGGVHRGAETSFDVSADLGELARTPVAVVCAGAKSVLDLPRTLELLETLGVPVIGHGCDEFPAFYMPRSGLPVSQRVDDCDTLARLLRLHRQLGGGGVLVAQPIPAEAALEAQAIEALTAAALADAHAAGVRGPAVTPYLLQRLHADSGGASLRANTALVRHNAALAARLAVALQRA